MVNNNHSCGWLVKSGWQFHHRSPSTNHDPSLGAGQEENDRAEMRWRNFQATKIQAVSGATVMTDERLMVQ